jgi:hypothetical protein
MSLHYIKNFESVLAFGDSHIAGCELSHELSIEECLKNNISIETADEPGKQLAFPKIVADALGIPCYNYAMTGGSNARSLRCLVTALQEHPDSLVLFGYTCTDRSEFYYPDAGNFLGRDKDNFIQVGVQWDIVGIKHPINDLFVKHIVRFYNDLEEVMFYSHCACKKYNSQIIHLPLFLENVPKIENVFNYEGYGNYISWCQAKGFKQMPFYHYGIEAHQELAQLILNTLKKRE